MGFIFQKLAILVLLANSINADSQFSHEKNLFEKYNRRLTQNERDKIYNELLNERNSPCIPDTSPDTSKC